MVPIVSAEITSILYLLIVLTGVFNRKNKNKSTVMFIWFTSIVLFDNLVEALSYLLPGTGCPDLIIYILKIMAYSGGTLAIIMYIHYCYMYAKEVTFVKRWVYLAPIILLFADFLYIVAWGIMGKSVRVENGVVTEMVVMPPGAMHIEILCIIYLTIVAMSLRKSLGTRVVLLLSGFNMIPVVAILLILIFNTEDYSFPASALATAALYVLVEYRANAAKEREQKRLLTQKNSQLEENQKRLEEATCEQEAQLEEISALNEQLTSSKEALERSNRLHEKRIATTAEAVNGGFKISRRDNEFSFIMVSENLAALAGYDTVKEFVDASNNCMTSIVPAEDVIREFPKAAESVRKGEMYTIHYRLRCKDGRWKNVEDRGRLITNENGEDEFWSFIIDQDEITKLSQAYGIIEGLSNEYHTIWVVNKDNRAMRLIRSTGISTIKEALQMGREAVNYDAAFDNYISNYVDPKDRERMFKSINFEEVIRQLSKNDNYSVNYLRKDEEGKVGYHQIAFVNADTAEGERQFVYGFRDIDKLVKEEDALKQQLNEAKLAAENADKAKTDFLFNMSHDIRTPMNAIIGFTELLDKNKDDKEKVNDYIEKIRGSSQFLLSLINNVLEMARIESGKMVLDEEPWSAEAFNDTLYSVFDEQMKSKNITFTRSINVNSKYIYCDSVKLREVFLNIISNAYKYTLPGGHVSMDLDELPCDREGYVLFRTKISDTGIGMSKEYLPTIFDEFTREHSSTESKVEGTGLGMPIVKKLVELMDGDISVESELGKGTVFTVTFYHKMADESSILTKESEVADLDAVKGKRILLAEDNDLNAEIAIEILENAGFVVERAEDGVVCIDMLQKKEAGFYDMILMDIQMPNMDGYKTTQFIRSMDDASKKDIIIIAMTANAFEEDKRNALESGMNGHLSKPIDVDKLLMTISKTLK